jgi:hypothetical protein
LVSTSMNCLGHHGMFYLAAAVSDFYVPWESMVGSTSFFPMLIICTCEQTISSCIADDRSSGYAKLPFFMRFHHWIEGIVQEINFVNWRNYVKAEYLDFILATFTVHAMWSCCLILLRDQCPYYTRFFIFFFPFKCLQPKIALSKGTQYTTC